MSNQVVAKNWKTSQKYIRVGHNKAIKNYFKTVTVRTTREALRNSLLIYKNDSASQMLVKMQYFQQYLSGVKSNTVPVIPDSWQVKIEGNRPQLIVVFKPKSSKYPKQDSRWSMSIPHFDFNQANIANQLKKIPDYEKGKHQGVYTLKDNSNSILALCFFIPCLEPSAIFNQVIAITLLCAVITETSISPLVQHGRFSFMP